MLCSLLAGSPACGPTLVLLRTKILHLVFRAGVGGPCGVMTLR